MGGRLVVAVVILLASLFLLWHLETALSLQWDVMGLCWPRHVQFDDRHILTKTFWNKQVDNQDLFPVADFFARRMWHHICLYGLVVVALVGWSASILYRIVKAEDDSSVSRATWPYVVASLFLSIIAGGIIFLFLVGGVFVLDSENACLHPGWGIGAAASALAAGCFLTLFFQWFKGAAKTLWAGLTTPFRSGG